VQIGGGNSPLFSRTATVLRLLVPKRTQNPRLPQGIL